MLVKPAVTDLLKIMDDIFELITVTSKRARQIAQGAPVLTDHPEDKSPVTLAVWEVSEGKVKLADNQETLEEVSDDEF